MKKLLVLFLSLLCWCCSSQDDMGTEQTDAEVIQEDSNDNNNPPIAQEDTIELLSLGDSYTIGESVCVTCRFPEQLKDSLSVYKEDITINTTIVARTGWTTTQLISAIGQEDLNDEYDLVTLLIGVNNQFQRKPFELYETEFPQLLELAVSFANGDRSKVIVVSIPDYAYTTFGEEFARENTSEEIDKYNDFAKTYSVISEVTFINITDITRQGLDNPDLVADDGLHPSELAYSYFVERILPEALGKVD